MWALVHFGIIRVYFICSLDRRSLADLIKACFMIVQLIGVIAFIRGLVLLTHIGHGHGQQGSVGKAAAHIIAGILCINLYQFLQVVFNTLALGQI